MTALRHFYLARFILEARTPWSLSTGNPDGVFDTALVRDANGLPAIPGSSLAGVLRHLYQQQHGNHASDQLFGFQTRGQQHNAAASSVHIAWGCILDSHGRAVEGLVAADDPQRLQQDPLLAALLIQADTPITRDRVRIGARGAASDTGKFDRAILPAGHRFACEISLQSDNPADDQWQQLLALLADPRLRLGGSTRSGLGGTRLIDLWQRHYDLADPQQAAAFRQQPAAIDAPGKLHHTRPDPAALPAGWSDFTLELRAADCWRIGRGGTPLGNYPGGKLPDALPLVEERIRWDQQGQGRRSLSLALLPGSSLKGVLAHRVAYYANCLSGNWADDHNPGDDWDKSDPASGSPVIHALFGYSKDRADPGQASGQAGRIYIDDASIDVSPGQVSAMMHNAIDRFTGGVRERLLFAEELLWQTRISVRCLIDGRQLPPDALRALQLALDDLAAGRLSLGAGDGRGHGRFSANADSLPRLDASATAQEQAQ